MSGLNSTHANSTRQASASLDRLHEFAQHLEQSIAFGERNHTTQRQMEAELRGNYQRLSKVDIWRIMQRVLAGSTYKASQQEVEALYALQGQKDLYGILRSIVLATHQRTGALTGRIGKVELTQFRRIFVRRF